MSTPALPPPPTPFLVYGDGPRLPSGLGRIARDLLIRLTAEAESLNLNIMQVGVDPPDGWHWQAWPFWGFQPEMADQGRGALEQILSELDPEGPRPIVLMIMDPSRCFDLTRGRDPQAIEEGARPVRFWGYFPIDSENIQGHLSGPAAEAIWSCERVLGYGRYGAGVLSKTLQAQAAEVLGPTNAPRMEVAPIPYLPHGLDASFRPGIPLEEAGPGFAEWRSHLPREAWILGCVATNQPRKDLSLLFATAALLKREGAKVGVWLHTDRLTNAWDIGQLCHDFQLTRAEVCVSTADNVLSDPQLAGRYGASDCTLGVGLGEGFGYPLVESLACGTPVIHGRFGGGVELIPRQDWLVDPAAWRLESCYAVKRPVLKPEDVAGAVAGAVGWKRRDPAGCQAYCCGAVSYLGWDRVWPRWRSWVRRGLRARQEGA